MTSEIVPTGEPAPAADDATRVADDRRRRLRRRLAWLAGILLPLAGLVAAAFLVQLPYYLVQPGSVRPADERIEVTGARSYDDAGELMFTTVLLSKATPALLVRAALDDAIEVRTEEEMYPDGDVEGARRENFQRMDLSKLIATRVALEHVGIEAEFVAEGSKVLALVEDSPSEGLLEPGDVIVEVDGGRVGMPRDIATQLSDRKPGDPVEVVVRRGGSRQRRESVEVVLGAAEDGEGGTRPVLGVEVEPFEPSVDSEVRVVVESGQVSGPSAGLAWTLGIIDRLTPGPLTMGRRVAVTGEVFDDGTVGAVGGVVQKVSAVKRAGIGIFLYPDSTPEEEQREMRRVAGDEVALHPVGSVEEAVEVLVPGGVRRPH